MKPLTHAEKRALSPVCPPGLLGLYALSVGLVMTLIVLGVPVQDVALLLTAAAGSVIAVTNPAMATALVQAVGNACSRGSRPH